LIKANIAEGCESCIIDSEVVAADKETGKILPFQVLTTRSRKDVKIEDIKVNVCIYAFDCMLFNGAPCVRETLEERRAKLKKCLVPVEAKVKMAEQKDFEEIDEEVLTQMLNDSVDGSCEGLMLKTLREAATYEPSKRSLNWLKLKKDYLDGVGDTIDVVPIGAWMGRGKRTGKYGAFLLAVYDPDSEEYQTVCKAGTGFSDEDLDNHYAFFKEKVISKPESNYNVTDRMVPEIWFEACQVWEIKCADLSISPVHTSAFGVKADGKGIGLRFPRFLHIRPDKGTEDTTSAEQIADMFSSQACQAKDGGKDDEDDYF
jgi:DNA ligase-1